MSAAAAQPAQPERRPAIVAVDDEKEIGKGTGPRLATARRIVADRHDGSITVRSQAGRTAFVVRLPP